jgi:hypothetical protein
MLSSSLTDSLISSCCSPADDSRAVARSTLGIDPDRRVTWPQTERERYAASYTVRAHKILRYLFFFYFESFDFLTGSIGFRLTETSDYVLSFGYELFYFIILHNFSFLKQNTLKFEFRCKYFLYIYYPIPLTSFLTFSFHLHQRCFYHLFHACYIHCPTYPPWLINLRIPGPVCSFLQPADIFNTENIRIPTRNH